MKVIAINGSPKPKGNTYIALETVCNELENQGIGTEIINVEKIWNIIHGGKSGKVMQDGEGISVMKNLANNMAWLLKAREYSKKVLPLPEPMPREWTNFIR